jgi:hypothetical protein
MGTWNTFLRCNEKRPVTCFVMLMMQTVVVVVFVVVLKAHVCMCIRLIYACIILSVHNMEQVQILTVCKHIFELIV